MKIRKWIWLLFSLLCVFNHAFADGSFREFIYDLQRQALQRGISPWVVRQALGNVQLLYQHVTHARAYHASPLTFLEYLNKSVTEKRIEQGRIELNKHHQLLTQIAHDYHIPANLIVALWGLETNYGHIQGDYPEISNLVTLAYRDRRRRMFREQLMDALQILDKRAIDMQDMRGSWAGAMGQCQFMPSAYLDFAVDYNHDGRKDIWHNSGDIFASMANFLQHKHFNLSHPILIPVQVPTAIGRWEGRYEHSVNYWLNQGVRSKAGYVLPHSQAMASLFFPDHDSTQGYLVYSDNFRAVYHWNQSTYYVLSIGVLMNELTHK
ncbi:MAG: lytic murein transglycosylase [Legionellales bacterium]|nr:lytic murein transglycosylase [Legionellales bacterium]